MLPTLVDSKRLGFVFASNTCELAAMTAFSRALSVNVSASWTSE